MELALGIAGLVLAVLLYLLGVWSGRKSEETIRDEVAAVPSLTATAVSSMLETVSDLPSPEDHDRGWEAQYAATFGYAPLLAGGDGGVLLVEYPYGAHSAVLIALHDNLFEPDVRNRIMFKGSVMNGTGARFHVREANDGSRHEVVTLDYVQPLREDRSFADMPTQAVYYQLEAEGFEEVGRGAVYDSVEAPWDIPRSVEPFLAKEWIREQRM